MQVQFRTNYKTERRGENKILGLASGKGQVSCLK